MALLTSACSRTPPPPSTPSADPSAQQQTLALADPSAQQQEPPALAVRLRNAATDPIAPDMVEDWQRLMKAMTWVPETDWNPELSGPLMFDALWKMEGLRFGRRGSDRRMVVFSDPGTGFDLALARQISQAGASLDAEILVLPLGTGMFDPSSGTKVAMLSCLPDPEAAWLEWARSPPDADASNQSSWSSFMARHKLPQSCDRGPALISIFQAAQAIGVDYTPYVVFPDGEAWPTATPSLQALLRTLDYEPSSIDHPDDRVLNEE